MGLAAELEVASAEAFLRAVPDVLKARTADVSIRPRWRASVVSAVSTYGAQGRGSFQVR